MKNTDEFRKALEHKKLPLLVLDQKWHRLFAIHGKTDEIRNAETELNNLFLFTLVLWYNQKQY